MRTAEKQVFPPHREYLTDVSGEVLDIGSGTGANFPYFAQRGDLRLHAIEPDPHMAKRARQKAAVLDLDLDLRTAEAEALPFDDETFDVVVAGIVFCTISDPETALTEVARVLKPGGEFRFLEHVRDHGLTAWAQGIVEPVWKRAAGGCHLTRETATLFKHHPAFELVEMKQVDMGVFPAEPFVRGCLRTHKTQQ
jgi:ubiquinone/menaquinone biosynthesis C-methylase UbiE